MNRLRVLSFLAALGSLSAAPALAGQKYAYPVYGGTGYMSGSISGARNSADTAAWLQVEVLSTTGYSIAYFYGADSAGHWGTCFTQSPAMINTARSVGPDSIVWVSWGTNGVCNYLTVSNTSDADPKRF